MVQVGEDYTSSCWAEGKRYLGDTRICPAVTDGKRAGGQPASTRNSQELIKDSNQAEIFSRQLITNCNEVAALGRGCFFSCWR